MTQSAMIQVKGLTKLFGAKNVLRGLDFHAEKSEVIAILGPNGAGKSTFIRILATLTRPTEGMVRVAGFSMPEQASSIRSHVGVITHQAFLYGDLTADENLRFYARMYGIGNTANRINDVIAFIGLSTRKYDLVRTYSRGMQQRLAIGRAILHNPEILLLDEPHTGLDHEACEMLDALMTQIAADGRTVIFTSHDLVKAEKAATRFDVLARGVITRSKRVNDAAKLNIMDFYNNALLVEKGT